LSPRPYRAEQRRAGAGSNRERIVAAGRELLAVPGGFGGFSMEAVARRADVSRLTVYYQFGSKVGLLEAIFNDLAARGGMDRLASAFAQPNGLDALREFVAVFGRFWNSDRLVIRRVRALAALDAEFDEAIVARDTRRLEGASVIVRRLSAERGRPPETAIEEAAGILYTLTSFATFDSLAGQERSIEDVIPLVQNAALAVLGFAEEAGSRPTMRRSPRS